MVDQILHVIARMKIQWMFCFVCWVTKDGAHVFVRVEYLVVTLLKTASFGDTKAKGIVFDAPWQPAVSFPTDGTVACFWNIMGTPTGSNRHCDRSVHSDSDVTTWPQHNAGKLHVVFVCPFLHGHCQTNTVH